MWSLTCRLSLVVLAVVITEHRISSAREETTGNGELCSVHYTDPAAQTIQSLYSKLSSADCALANSSNYPPHYNPVDEEEFDFIVIGAGSAGSVVANRLTEVSGWRVLLLEAGGDPTKSSEVPGLFPTLQKTSIDWQYKTEPSETYCLGMEGNQCNWPRGKVLGGSSTINYMVYVRGNIHDYNRWEKEGNKGWGYKDVLPYFKKYEDMRAEEVLKTPEFGKYHSTGGYMKVESWQNDEVKFLADTFAKGMRELHYCSNPDVNSKSQTGFVTLQGTLQDGKRCSTAKAFLTPIILRENLKVSKQSLASKILIDGKNNAYGVEFINKEGKVIRVRAKKEVVVSGGTVNTPQLLMLSGIGPRKHLEELNIKVIKDLPVGENLEDHPMMVSAIMTVNYSYPIESPEESMAKLLLNARNRFSSLGMVTYPMFINTVRGVDYPDVAIYPISIDKNNTANLALILDILGYKSEIKNKYLEINRESYVLVLLCSSLRPYSLGNIKLKSANPKEYPKITPGYFSDQKDIETFMRTYDFLSKLVNTKGLRSIDTKLVEIEVPECSKFKYASREFRECSLRHLTSTTYHPTSTCRMGPPGSTDSVVDPDLLVKGVNKLRVVDASVMRHVVSGNTNAAVIMIGEKASDLIKETWFHN